MGSLCSAGLRDGSLLKPASWPGAFQVEHIGAAGRIKSAQKVQLALESGSVELARDPVLAVDHLHSAIWGNRAAKSSEPC